MVLFQFYLRMCDGLKKNIGVSAYRYCSRSLSGGRRLIRFTFVFVCQSLSFRWLNAEINGPVMHSLLKASQCYITWPLLIDWCTYARHTSITRLADNQYFCRRMSITSLYFVDASLSSCFINFTNLVTLVRINTSLRLIAGLCCFVERVISPLWLFLLC